MDDYIVITGVQDTWYITRTADWVVIAECGSLTFANQVAAALN